MGMAKLNGSKNQKVADKALFTQTLKVKGNRLTDSPGMKIDMLQKDEVLSNADEVSGRILNQLSDVELALYRKKISDNYHTTVPKFMRSQGPFAVYDHGVHKGAHSFETIGKVNEQALNRFVDEINSVQKKRETEKNQFYSAMDYMDRMEFFKS